MRAPITDSHTRAGQAMAVRSSKGPLQVFLLADEAQTGAMPHDIYDFSFWTACFDSSRSPIPPAGLPETYFVFRDVMQLAWRSPSARSLIRFAAERAWSMTCHPMDDGAYVLDTDARQLVLNDHGLRHDALLASGYFRHTFVLALLRGLRDIWHMECRQPHMKGLRVEDVLLLERVRTADCDVVAQLIAWELRGDGAPELWRHLIGSPEGDMALAFMRRLERDPAATFDSAALIYSFREWFGETARVDACDHLALDTIDADLNDPDLSGLYGSQRVSAAFIESLSRLPDRTCYLNDYGDVILKDPVFAGLNSDVNQAHYMQIRRDLECVRIGPVAFRDRDLARKIFPEDAEEVV